MQNRIPSCSKTLSSVNTTKRARYITAVSVVPLLLCVVGLRSLVPATYPHQNQSLQSTCFIDFKSFATTGKLRTHISDSFWFRVKSSTSLTCSLTLTLNCQLFRATPLQHEAHDPFGLRHNDLLVPLHHVHLEVHLSTINSSDIVRRADWLDPYSPMCDTRFFNFKHPGSGFGCTLVGDRAWNATCETWSLNNTVSGYGSTCHDRMDSIIGSDTFGWNVFNRSRNETCFVGFDSNCTKSNAWRAEIEVPRTECHYGMVDSQLKHEKGTGQVEMMCWDRKWLGYEV